MRHQGVAFVLGTVWICLALYSWFGPALFRRLVAKELGQVRLDEGF
jgi:hypothetical protein